MRWAVELIAGLSLVGAVGAAAVVFRQDRQADGEADRVASEVRRLQLEVKYRAATEKAELNPWGWPVTIDPEWFTGEPPTNTLVSAEHPWVEVAGANELGFTHPRVRLAVDSNTAGFWYNPTTGVVRARVPVRMNDSRTLALYNTVNDTSLNDLYAVERARAIPTPAPPRGSEQAKSALKSGDTVSDTGNTTTSGEEEDLSIFYDQPNSGL